MHNWGSETMQLQTAFWDVLSRDNGLLVRAFVIYVRPILEYNSIIWSPSLVHDWHWAIIREGSTTICEQTARYEKFIIQQTTSSVRFAKLEIVAPAPRRSILLQNRFGLVSVNLHDFFEIRSFLGIGRPLYKLFKSRFTSNIRSRPIFCWACHKYMEQCKFFYVAIISTNNSKCKFFTVYKCS